MTKSNIINTLIITTISATTLAQTKIEPWVSELNCGGAYTYISTKCTASKENPDFNDCQKPQVLTNSKSDAFKSIGKEIPEHTKNEKYKYKKNGTLDHLFAVGWSCINIEKNNIIRIYFATGTGNNEYDEKVEYYNTDRSRIIDENYIKKIRQSIKNKQFKDKSIKSIFSE